MKTKGNEKLTEQRLKEAAKKADEAILNRLDEELSEAEAREGAHVFSDAFEEKMAPLLKEAKGTSVRAKRPLRWQPYAAAAALLIAVLSGVLLTRTPVGTPDAPAGTDVATAGESNDPGNTEEMTAEGSVSDADATVEVADAAGADATTDLSETPVSGADAQEEDATKESRIISFFKSLGERRKSNQETTPEGDKELAAADFSAQDAPGNDNANTSAPDNNTSGSSSGGNASSEPASSARADTGKGTTDNADTPAKTTDKGDKASVTVKDTKDAASAVSGTSSTKSATRDITNVAEKDGVKKADYNRDKSSEADTDEEESDPEETTESEDAKDSDTGNEDSKDDTDKNTDSKPSDEVTGNAGTAGGTEETQESAASAAEEPAQESEPALPGGVSIGDALYGFSSASSITVTNHANGVSATLTPEDAELNNILAAFNGFRVADAAESSASGAYSVNIDGTVINFDSDHIYRGGVCFTGGGLGAVCAFISQLCS